MMKRVSCFRILGAAADAEYIVCTYCLNIVGATSLTAPMVLTPKWHVIISQSC